jgi:membrane-associated progesterone receptor component
VFDVSSKRDFYGKDGAYGIFAGKDCTKAIAKWTKNEEDMTSDIVREKS